VPTRDEAPIGAPCWIELGTSNPDKSRTFYGELFGWTSEQAGEEYGGYINFSQRGVMVAGCMGNAGQPNAQDAWSIYLAAEDAELVTKAAAANGGSVVLPPMQVMELGTMAFVVDPGGAAIGVWQPGLNKGFGVYDEPGSPSWFELHTPAYDVTVDFYREVFGWDPFTMSDTQDFRYTTLGEGEAALAGILDATGLYPEGTPAQWSIYFGTADTDASLAKAVELGATVVTAAEDTPYGRLAEAVDPVGARFKLRSTSRS
jgi:hypothetical protein